MKDLTTLLIELDQVNRKIDRIKNDPDYIKKETDRVFANTPKRDYKAELNAILDTAL